MGNMISMVLPTDIANHFSELSSFKNKLNSKAFPTARAEDKQILLNILLHSSDISNPGKKLDTFMKWIPRVMEEFFRQGDMEEEKNMQVSMFYDRHSTSVAQCQKGFMDVIVIPTFSVLAELIPQVDEFIMPNLTANHAYYAAQLVEGSDLEEKKSRHFNFNTVKSSLTKGINVISNMRMPKMSRMFRKNLPEKTA